jgi:hypothetical protein
MVDFASLAAEGFVASQRKALGKISRFCRASCGFRVFAPIADDQAIGFKADMFAVRLKSQGVIQINTITSWDSTPNQSGLMTSVQMA